MTKKKELAGRKSGSSNSGGHGGQTQQVLMDTPSRAKHKCNIVTTLIEKLTRHGHVRVCVNLINGHAIPTGNSAVVRLVAALRANFIAKHSQIGNSQSKHHVTAFQGKSRRLSVFDLCIEALEECIEHKVLLTFVRNPSDHRETGSRVFTSTADIIVKFLHDQTGIWFETPHRNSAAHTALRKYVSESNKKFRLPVS